MPQGPPDLPRLAAALASEEVQYVLVGGLALILRGGRHVTFDADLAIAFNAENRSRVVRALAPLPASHALVHRYGLGVGRKVYSGCLDHLDDRCRSGRPHCSFTGRREV